MHRGRVRLPREQPVSWGSGCEETWVQDLRRHGARRVEVKRLASAVPQGSLFYGLRFRIRGYTAVGQLEFGGSC